MNRIEILEQMLKLRSEQHGPNAPETLRIKRQLDAAKSSPVSAKAMFLMGGRKHSGEPPVHSPRRKRSNP